MIRKTSNITFNKYEIEKAISKREPSSFWPRTNYNTSVFEKQNKQRKPKREDINITGSVLKRRDD